MSNPTPQSPLLPVQDDGLQDPKITVESPSSVKDAALFYRPYVSEAEDMDSIIRLCEGELSEPYNVFTFRYFFLDWPHLTFLVFPSPTSKTAIGTIVCKQDMHRGLRNRGYIAMLSVDRKWRRRGIATKLAKMAIEEMRSRGAEEVVIETEVDNQSSLALYESLDFFREKRLHRFYTNGKDAFRLVLPLVEPNPSDSEDERSAAQWLIPKGGS